MGVGYTVHVHWQQSQATSWLAGRQCAAVEGTSAEAGGIGSVCLKGVCSVPTSDFVSRSMPGACLGVPGADHAAKLPLSCLLQWLRCGACTSVAQLSC